MAKTVLKEEYNAQAISTENAEPWESWETKLVLYSLLLGLLVFVGTGILVNIFWL